MTVALLWLGWIGAVAIGGALGYMCAQFCFGRSRRLHRR